MSIEHKGYNYMTTCMSVLASCNYMRTCIGLLTTNIILGLCQLIVGTFSVYISLLLQ